MKTSTILSVILLLVAFSALAEDGELFVRNISKTPDDQTSFASMNTMYAYVPAVDSGGEPATITYTLQDGTTFERTSARPLIAFYHDGPLVHLEDKSGDASIGHRDVFGAVSLDDGNTWKRSNLSDSAYRSSFRLDSGFNYPGDTYRLFSAAHGTKVMVAWASRYAAGGNPTYAMSDEDLDLLRAHLQGVTGLDEDQARLYTVDMWGIAGSQGSHDYTEDGFPEVGELPYCSLWVARGTLEDLDADGDYEIAWRKAERLTSGVRDVHRIECGAAKGAGFVITWQEDPEGLRPGEGEGPGEGWSGAVAHHETDIWYSFIDWDDFDLVQDDSVEGFAPIPLTQEIVDRGVPTIGVPFSIPVRISDNGMGHYDAEVAEGYDSDTLINDEADYLYEDFDGDGTADLCAYTVEVTIPIRVANGDADVTETICVTQDGRLLRGNIAATRARVNLRGYNAEGDADGVNESAWVIMAYEESKGLGEDEDLDQVDALKIDMGKNIWYHTFDMFRPEVCAQGLNLNGPAPYPDVYAEALDGQAWDDPEVDPADFHAISLVRETLADGRNIMRIVPDPIYEEEAGLTNTVLYQHEIARRFSLISQEVGDINPQANGGSGMAAFALFKQGIVRQGGPADIFGRRFVAPADWDPTTQNPFDYSCLECGEWLFEDGSNPRYVRGLCLDPALNMSATTRVLCDGEEPCAQEYPFTAYFDDADLSSLEDETLQKTSTWVQNGPDFSGTLSSYANSGNSYEDVADYDSFDDTSWENPYEVAKGHRGFLKGDHILLLYAWSPNHLANSVGHDNYNLYVRRSFDGGGSWTTTPAAFDPHCGLPSDVTVTADGTTWYEWQGPAGSDTEFRVTYELGEGDFEPARNVSLLTGTRLTVLDPRFCPAGLTIPGTMYPEDDVHDPSKFFLTFEVGDNTTVEFGEAEPLDMYYSRATNYGDDFDVVLAEDPDETENLYYFDWLENKRQVHAAEAAVFASPGGQFFYAIWNQWEYDALENEIESDANMRRWYWASDVDDGETDPSGGGGDDDTPPPGPGGGQRLPGKPPVGVVPDQLAN